MAEKLTFILEFDQKTGGLKVVQTGLKKVEKAAKDAGKAAQDTGSSLKGIGNIIGAIGIGAFLLSTARSAAAGSDSMNELNETWKATVGIITETLEPAIALVSRGLQGLMVTVQGLAKVFKDLAAGEFTDAWNSILDTIQAGGDRAAGITKQIERVQSKIILEEGKIRLADLALDGNQKLAIIEEIEREALRLLRESGEFQTADKKRRAKAELEILKELSTERESAEMEARAQRLAAIEAEITAEQALSMLRFGNEALDLETRLAAFDEFNLQTRKKIVDAGKQKNLDQDTINKQLLVNDAKNWNLRQKITASRIKIEAKIEAKKQADKLGLTIAQQAKIEAIVFRHSDILIRQAAQATGNIRDLLKRSAAESVKIEAQKAAKSIQMASIDLAWKAGAAVGFPASLVVVPAIIAAGAAAAAGVAALGGAAAAALTGGPSGLPSIPVSSPFAQPLPVIDVGGGGGGFGTGGAGGEAFGGGDVEAGEAVVFGEAPGAVGAGVQVSVLVLGDLSDDAAEKIGEAVAEGIG